MYDELDDEIMLGMEAMVVLPADLDLSEHPDDTESVAGRGWMRTRAERDFPASMTIGEDDDSLQDMLRRIFSAQSE